MFKSETQRWLEQQPKHTQMWLQKQTIWSDSDMWVMLRCILRIFSRSNSMSAINTLSRASGIVCSL
jgi:hypothetical protein